MIKIDCWRELYKSREAVSEGKAENIKSGRVCPECGEKYRLVFAGRAYGENGEAIGSAERYECLCGEVIKIWRCFDK